ncbi:MAG TPA: hypothetical protein VGM19_07160 [Armatimonadota bacterium]|jgi:hypothetical protein
MKDRIEDDFTAGKEGRYEREDPSGGTSDSMDKPHAEDIEEEEFLDQDEEDFAEIDETQDLGPDAEEEAELDELVREAGEDNEEDHELHGLSDFAYTDDESEQPAFEAEDDALAKSVERELLGEDE